MKKKNRGSHAANTLDRNVFIVYTDTRIERQKKEKKRKMIVRPYNEQ